MSKIGVFITVRLASSRLPYKAFKEVRKKKMIEYTIDRIKNFVSEGAIYICTTTLEEDFALDNVAEKNKVNCFHGSPTNIPLRHFKCAKENNIDFIINIDGDDVLCFPELIDKIINQYNENPGYYDVIKTKNYPFGTNVVGYKTEVMEKILNDIDRDVIDTGWGLLLDDTSFASFIFDAPYEFKNDIRLTLDYEEDFLLFEHLIKALNMDTSYAGMQQILEYIKRNPSIKDINSHLVDGYYKTFNSKMRAESMSKNIEYRKKAHKYIPGGAHTYSRGDDQFPENAPAAFVKGKGAYTWDVDGNKFLDYSMGLRCVTVGYGYERIANAAIEQIKNGNNLAKASKIEIDAAEKLVNLIDGMDMVKFAKNGSTVTTSATKLARAYTGRKYIARCLQHPFFSYDDWFIGDTVVNRGVPDEIRGLTLNFNFNDIESLKNLFDKYPSQIACVILEPSTNIEPTNNFLTAIRELCNETGAIFILDEMITGFRWDMKGAQHYYGVTPDMCTFGKAIANGFSLGALLGKREIMELGGICHNQERVFLMSTTHGAEMSSLAALSETIDVYKELDVITHLWDYGKKLISGVNDIAKEFGIDDYVYMDGPAILPTYICKDDKKAISMEYRTLFNQEMMKGGVLMPYISMSYSHQATELDLTLTAVRGALEVYKEALNSNVAKFLVGKVIKPVFRKYN